MAKVHRENEFSKFLDVGNFPLLKFRNILPVNWLLLTLYIVFPKVPFSGVEYMYVFIVLHTQRFHQISSEKEIEKQS